MVRGAVDEPAVVAVGESRRDDEVVVDDLVNLLEELGVGDGGGHAGETRMGFSSSAACRMGTGLSSGGAVAHPVVPAAKMQPTRKRPGHRVSPRSQTDPRLTTFRAMPSACRSVKANEPIERKSWQCWLELGRLRPFFRGVFQV